MADLIPIAEARGRVLDAVRALPAEPVALGEALGRVLAEDVSSDISVPPFDSSAMDGYAVVAGEGGELELIGEARAGHPAQVAVRPGATIAISTGGAVPEGATAVVPVERTERVDGGVRVPATEPDANIRRAGEDIAAGDLVLRPRHGADARRDRRRRVGRAQLGLVRPPPAGSSAAHGRRAHRPGRAAGSRRHLQLERLRAGRAGHAGGRRAGRERAGGRQRGRHAGGARRRARRGRRRGRLGRRLGRSARPRQGRARGAGRRGALLGRAAASRQADLVRHARRHARLRPARQPGLRDGDLPAVRAAGPGGAPGRRPGRDPHHGRARRADRAQRPTASRRSACA